ncbi:hypothetical protein EC847_1476 [Scandinavium goeteborgense]|uniref:Uncharacterized protein n=1 Tax=Scandinavium goeteborgense TaxID=1851514 RepID=A0A4R6DMI0_SCAGO|nr:hypothetical protein EC847_1476 [Scandinavium goeteborgense]
MHATKKLHKMTLCLYFARIGAKVMKKTSFENKKWANHPFSFFSYYSWQGKKVYCPLPESILRLPLLFMTTTSATTM